MSDLDKISGERLQDHWSSSKGFYGISDCLKALRMSNTCGITIISKLVFRSAADLCICFRYIDSRIPLLCKFEISSLKPSSVAVKPSLCWNWSETLKTGSPRSSSSELLP